MKWPARVDNRPQDGADVSWGRWPGFVDCSQKGFRTGFGNSEPLKSVAIEFVRQSEQNARITRGLGPTHKEVVLPLFLKTAKPLYPLRRYDTADIGKITWPKTSGD